jgi:hypothetical protein
LNADDPLWFDATVTDQYRVARDVWSFGDEAIADVAATALRIDGMSASTRTRFAAALRDWRTSTIDPVREVVA